MKKTLLYLGGLWLVVNDGFSAFLLFFYHENPWLFLLGILGLLDLPLFFFLLLFRPKIRPRPANENLEISPELRQDALIIQKALRAE